METDESSSDSELHISDDKKEATDSEALKQIAADGLTDMIPPPLKPDPLQTRSGQSSKESNEEEEKPFACRYGCGSRYKMLGFLERHHKHFCPSRDAPSQKKRKMTTDTDKDLVKLEEVTYDWNLAYNSFVTANKELKARLAVELANANQALERGIETTKKAIERAEKAEAENKELKIKADKYDAFRNLLNTV